MLQNANQVPKTTHAVLEHISGPGLGTRTILSRNNIDVIVGEDRSLRTIGTDRPPPKKPRQDAIARLKLADGTFNLQALGEAKIWINGRQVQSAELVNDDVVEFGEKGPLSRFQLIDSSAHSRRYFSDICEDCWDYLQTSRKPPVQRTVYAVFDGLRRLVTETTILFRIGVVTMLALLAYVSFQQYRLNEMQQEQLVSGDVQLEAFARQLTRSQEEAITPAELEKIREDLSQGLAVQLDRLETLEQRTQSTERVIFDTAGSVVFLQGAYGFREKSTKKPLRFVLGPMERPIAGPNGQPLLSVDGEGKIAERQFTGTGFAVGDGTVLATNRHVAVPWGKDAGPSAPNGKELEPFMIRFVAYAPGRPEGEEVELIRASENRDLALVRMIATTEPLTAIDVSRQALAQGGQVIVMGYPTGLRSMVARSGKEFLAELQETKTTNFWEIAGLLADRDLIQPLSSSGIVAQTSTNFIVYDAATTQGGSGGPVLNLDGEIVAVNAAILPGYDGSNLGIPAEHLLQLMDKAGISKTLVAN